jgi:hypothetical protein
MSKRRSALLQPEQVLITISHFISNSIAAARTVRAAIRQRRQTQASQDIGNNEFDQRKIPSCRNKSKLSKDFTLSHDDHYHISVTG